MKKIDCFKHLEPLDIHIANGVVAHENIAKENVTQFVKEAELAVKNLKELHFESARLEIIVLFFESEQDFAEVCLVDTIHFSERMFGKIVCE